MESLSKANRYLPLDSWSAHIFLKVYHLALKIDVASKSCKTHLK